MTAEERRWKWVKKESQPEELKEIIEKLSKKTTKKEKKERERFVQNEVDDVSEQTEQAEFVTTVKTRNDLLIDYSIIANVKERLEMLKQERFKGKF